MFNPDGVMHEGIFAFAAKNGVILEGGVIHEALQYVDFFPNYTCQGLPLDVGNP